MRITRGGGTFDPLNHLSLNNDLHYNRSGYIDEANASHQDHDSALLTSAVQYTDNAFLQNWTQRGRVDRPFYYESANRLQCWQHDFTGLPTGAREFLTYDDSGKYSATFDYDRLNRIRTLCENGATGGACQAFHYVGDSDWLSYTSTYNTVQQRYLYANCRPLRVDVRDSSTLYPYYLRYNARGDAGAVVQKNGDGGEGWKNYGAWGDANYGNTGYYNWNAAWGYMQFPANLNFAMHGGYDMGLYFAHGRWYNQDTGLWLSPWEVGKGTVHIINAPRP